MSNMPKELLYGLFEEDPHFHRKKHLLDLIFPYVVEIPIILGGNLKALVTPAGILRVKATLLERMFPERSGAWLRDVADIIPVHFREACPEENVLVGPLIGLSQKLMSYYQSGTLTYETILWRQPSAFLP